MRGGHLATGFLDADTASDQFLHLCDQGPDQRWVGARHRAGQHDGDLAEHTVGRSPRQLNERSAHDFLVYLGQLPADHRPTCTSELLDRVA